MNKKSWIIGAIVVAILIGGGIFFYSQYNKTPVQNQNNYETDRISSTNSLNETTENTTNQQTETKPNKEVKQGIEESNPTALPTKEEQIATFTTKIYSNDSARQNNISITCNTLNGTIVKKGEIFSFCGTVGQASTSKGYQKADIFDKNGNKKKGLGGRKLSNQFYTLQCYSNNS